MKKTGKFATTARFSPRASLAAVGVRLRALDIFEPIKDRVRIQQKTVKYSPAEKLQDAFVAILAGARSLCQINTHLRPDEVLQRAFGRQGCAEQSVVQDTLDACTSANVAQMMQAVDVIFRRHSLAFRHDYQAAFQLLDVDVTGLPCGPKAALSTKGYFSHQGIRYGRQLGRVIATHYEEVVVDRLYPGNVQLNQSLRMLVAAAEETLALDEAARGRTILRVDAGGGSLDDVNWMLGRGYQVHCKDYSSVRAEALASTVQQWFNDPRHPKRQLGWVNCDSLDYARPLRRLASRWPKKKGGFGYAVLISTLEPAEVIRLMRIPMHKVAEPEAVVLAYAALYDRRGGAVEIEIREDKQGIGLTKKSKKRFEAQQMVMLLSQLAHNVVVWVRRWMSASASHLAKFGIVRWVRDLFQLSGTVEFDVEHAIRRVALNHGAVLARRNVSALFFLLKPEEVIVTLGRT